MAWSKVDIYAFPTWTSINNDSETKQTKQIIEYQSVFFAICYFDREDRFRHSKLLKYFIFNRHQLQAGAVLGITNSSFVYVTFQRNFSICVSTEIFHLCVNGIFSFVCQRKFSICVSTEFFHLCVNGNFRFVCQQNFSICVSTEFFHLFVSWIFPFECQLNPKTLNPKPRTLDLKPWTSYALPLTPYPLPPTPYPLPLNPQIPEPHTPNP